MKEATLLKIALICSLTGLIILYFISTKIELKEDNTSLLNTNVGDDIKLEGMVTKITDKGNIVLLELNQQNSINVLLDDDNNLKLKNGDNIEVIGKIEEYNGEKEVIARKIRVIR